MLSKKFAITRYKGIRFSFALSEYLYGTTNNGIPITDKHLAIKFEKTTVNENGASNIIFKITLILFK